MQQDVQSVLTKLPLLPSDLPVFVARKPNPNCPNGYKDFIINRERILRWLVFLKNNNEHYKDIEIDYVVLQNLPVNGSIFHSLRSYDEDNDDTDDDNSIDAFADDGGLEPSPAPGTTGPYPDEENVHVTVSFACINPLHCDETNNNQILRILNEELGTENNPLPFPPQGERLNDYTYPSLQSMAFPTLFPFGCGDVSDRNRVSNVTLTNSNKHLLKYCIRDSISDIFVYLFAKHD